MFRFCQSSVPHFMTYSKGHLHLKFFCLIKLRKIIDMSLTDLYNKSQFPNYSSLSPEEMAFESEWTNEPYFNPPYVINVHDRVVSVFKLEYGKMKLKWVSDYPCEIFEKVNIKKRFCVVSSGGFGAPCGRHDLDNSIVVLKAQMKGWCWLRLDL